jgi:hypothetical protein
MTASRAKQTAHAFWLAAARSMEQRRLNTTQYQMLMVPGVVCAAFSIELGIKAMLLLAGSPPKTHNLAQLFSLLPQPIQQQIIASCGKPREAFDQSLAAIANVFDEWRYIYESEGMNLDNSFLSSLADSVKVAADAHAP